MGVDVDGLNMPNGGGRSDRKRRGRNRDEVQMKTKNRVFGTLSRIRYSQIFHYRMLSFLFVVILRKMRLCRPEVFIFLFRKQKDSDSSMDSSGSETESDQSDSEMKIDESPSYKHMNGFGNHHHSHINTNGHAKTEIENSRPRNSNNERIYQDLLNEIKSYGHCKYFFTIPLLLS